MSGWLGNLLALNGLWMLLWPAFSTRAAKQPTAPYRALLGAIVLLWGLIAGAGAAHGGELPSAARVWQPTVIREARAVWGVSAPASLFGAQIHQESHWDASARSAYAAGMAQFTAATARDMARWYPELGPADAVNPRWAIRALVRYDRRLWSNLADTATDCDRWAMTLSAYNGGSGWLTRDRALCRREIACDPSRWWGQVERQTQRADWARAENRAYPSRILLTLQPRYEDAGWPGAVACRG